MYNMGLENETELENIQNIQNIDTILNNMLDEMVDLNEPSNLNETSLNNSLLVGSFLREIISSISLSSILTPIIFYIKISSIHFIMCSTTISIN